MDEADSDRGRVSRRNPRCRNPSGSCHFHGTMEEEAHPL